MFIMCVCCIVVLFCTLCSFSTLILLVGSFDPRTVSADTLNHVKVCVNLTLSTSAANRAWLAIVPLYRRRFATDTAIIALTKYFPYLYYNRSNIAKITCTPLSPHSAKHQQRARIIADIAPITAKVHLYQGSRLDALRPSICLVPTIYSKSECRRNNKQILDT